MTATIPFNPNNTTNAAGTFQVQSTGLVQGMAEDSPAVRYELQGGVLSANETKPMWGGVGISTLVQSNVNAPNTLGPTIQRATTLLPATSGTDATLRLQGFSVFDQNHAMINTPQSPVPLAASGMMVNYYPFGSEARIAVAIDPALVNLVGALNQALVSWDFALQRLVPYVAAYPANVLTAQTWAANVITYTTTSAHGLSVGSDFTITGSTPAGYNGTFTAIAGTTGSTIKATSLVNPGTSTVLGTLVAGGGAIPVFILRLEIGNSMTVSYSDPALGGTGFATWNRSGSCAVISI